MPMIDDAAWQQARRVLRNGLTSNLHCSIASVDPDGRPHVTPIGSVMLAPEPGRGIFFDILNARLSRNVDAAPTICVLAVDSRKTVWLPRWRRGDSPIRQACNSTARPGRGGRPPRRRSSVFAGA